MNAHLMAFQGKGNRRIVADCIYFTRTYRGLIKGLPSERVNEEILEGLPCWLHRVFGEHPIFVLPPKIQAYDWSHPAAPAVMKRIHEMPPVCAAALLECEAPILKGPGSSLVVAWFQDTPSLPVGPSILAELEQLDWELFARDNDEEF